MISSFYQSSTPHISDSKFHLLTCGGEFRKTVLLQFFAHTPCNILHSSFFIRINSVVYFVYMFLFIWNPISTPLTIIHWFSFFSHLIVRINLYLILTIESSLVILLHFIVLVSILCDRLFNWFFELILIVVAIEHLFYNCFDYINCYCISHHFISLSI